MQTNTSDDNNQTPKPDLESIINEVSASEDFQNLLKSVSKNIGSIVANAKNNTEFENLIKSAKPPNPPNPASTTSESEEPSNPDTSEKTGSSKPESDNIRTVPLESSVHADEDTDTIQDTVLTLLSDSEGNTLGEIAASMDQHLKVIAEQLTNISERYTRVNNECK